MPRDQYALRHRLHDYYYAQADVEVLCCDLELPPREAVFFNHSIPCMPTVEHELGSTPPCTLYLPGSDAVRWVREAIESGQQDLRTTIEQHFAGRATHVEVHGPTSQLSPEFDARPAKNSSGLFGVIVHAPDYVLHSHLEYSTLGGSPSLSKANPRTVIIIIQQALDRAQSLLQSGHADPDS